MFKFTFPGYESLTPIDRFSEVMFGLLMVLTYTCTIMFSLGEGATVSRILLAALGCNIAWGIIDGGMYIMRTAAGRGVLQSGRLRFVEMDQEARTAKVATILEENFSCKVSDATAAAIARDVVSTTSTASEKLIGREDIRTAFAIAVLVIISSLPPMIPFLLTDNVTLAVRVSNIIALSLMIFFGYKLDQLMGRRIILMRWLVPLFGVLMVLTAIAFGG